MRNHFSQIRSGCSLAFACMAFVAKAQPSAPAAGPDATVVANPTYISIPLEITVNRPAAEVWKRVGKYCDIGEWLQIACTITSGKDGEFGTVRSVGGRNAGGQDRTLLHLHADRAAPAGRTTCITARSKPGR